MTDDGRSLGEDTWFKQSKQEVERVVKITGGLGASIEKGWCRGTRPEIVLTSFSFISFVLVG